VRCSVVNGVNGVNDANQVPTVSYSYKGYPKLGVLDGMCRRMSVICRMLLYAICSCEGTAMSVLCTSRDNTPALRTVMSDNLSACSRKL
jgi:hypothetical protein